MKVSIGWIARQKSDGYIHGNSKVSIMVYGSYAKALKHAARYTVKDPEKPRTWVNMRKETPEEVLAHSDILECFVEVPVEG